MTSCYSCYPFTKQEVDTNTKMARIMYTTGEVEELDLDEIARDMHMHMHF